MNWHKVQFPCLKCGSPLHLIALRFGVNREQMDLQMLIECHCNHCSTDTEWLCNLSDVARACVMADEQSPPKADPPPPLTHEDVGFLHELGIKDEDKDEK